MKRVAIPAVICMAFLFAAMLPAIAQDDHQDDRNNGTRQEDRHDQAQPQQDRNQQDRQTQDRQTQDRQMHDRQDENRRDDNRPAQDRQMQDRQMQDHHDQAAHDQAARDQHANGRRIDEAHYRQNFGRDHHFAVHHIERFNGRDGFAYGGYQFVFAQPWPAGWSYDDDCYIEDVDGQYYLYDLRHPGVRIMLMVM